MRKGTERSAISRPAEAASQTGMTVPSAGPDHNKCGPEGPPLRRNGSRLLQDVGEIVPRDDVLVHVRNTKNVARRDEREVGAARHECAQIARLAGAERASPSREKSVTM